MNKEEILKHLGVTKFPKEIGLNYCNNILYMQLSASSIDKNMQNDASAFEGWIFCLKFKKDSALVVTEVHLDWEAITTVNGHYRRFLFRVYKLIQKCSNWFDVNPAKKLELISFCESLGHNLVLNYPITTSKKYIVGISESSIEEVFVTYQEIFHSIIFDFQGNQLPVGVFKDSVSRGREFFTAGKSAIDLWGVLNDELWIFELKYQNRKVGILSEMLFYLWIMEEVFLLKTIMSYPVLSEKLLEKSKRNFDLLYKYKFQRIIGVLFIDTLHPLVNEHVISEMNNVLGAKLELKIQKYRIDPVRLV